MLFFNKDAHPVWAVRGRLPREIAEVVPYPVSHSALLSGFYGNSHKPLHIFQFLLSMQTNDLMRHISLGRFPPQIREGGQNLRF